MNVGMPATGHPSQRGFSLIEVLVAITVLLVGVLGVVALVDGANAITVRTKAREGATNVSRSIIEVGRAVPYKDLDEDALLAALGSRPGLADALPQGGHQIRHRGFTYDLTVQVCSMDDPRDDLGVDDGTVNFCPESVAATGGGTLDRNPDDYRRIAVTLRWKRGTSSTIETAKQTSIVPNPVGGLGPSVIDLDPDLTGASPYVVTTGSSIDFDVTTSAASSTVNWLVAGSVQGQAEAKDASGKTWEFTWDLDDPTTFYDCTWVVGAEAFDEDGRSGAPKSVTVVLNRFRPPVPDNFEGGRNANSSILGVRPVDLEWREGPECDVLGYQVFRSVTGSGVWTQIECRGQDQPEYHTGLTCLDETAPDLVPLSYRVRGVDTLASGGLGFGSPAEIDIDNGTQTRPDPPSGLVACVGGAPGCNEANGEPASDGVTVLTWTAPPNPDADGDSIYFYRIYRDWGTGGPTYDDRYAAYVHGPGVLAWADPETPDGPHKYCVTAVDERFGESLCSAEIANFP
jgi:prepilin-type N-terminal cleavage/methylation domain-containing protein